MATITSSPPRLGLPGILRTPAVRKLLLLALAAAILVPWPAPAGRAAAGRAP